MKTVAKGNKRRKAIKKRIRAKVLASRGTKVVARQVKKVRPESGIDLKILCRRFRMVRSDLTRLTGYSQRSVDQWATGETPSLPARKQLHETKRLLDGLAEIMESTAVGPWLKEPNPAFDGSTPLQVAERGESDRLWRMIYEVQTGEPI
ncbi:MAG: antitoxin Xre/MbcA/ParS toxin-binding domain-containing protein [Verrucomicrobiales bacterium]